MKKSRSLSFIIISTFLNHIINCSNSSSQQDLPQQFSGGTHHHTYHNHVSQMHNTSPPSSTVIHNSNNNDSNIQGGSNQTYIQQTTWLQNSITQSMTNWYENAKNKAPAYINMLLNNKLQITLGALTCSYVYLCYQLHKIHTMIKSSQSWCNWKQIVSMQHLVSTPYQDLIPELLNDIQKKYFFKVQFSNNKEITTLSFEQFIQDVQQELITLKYYLSLQKMIKTCWLSMLFGRLYHKQVIKEKISRLQIILDIFVTWHTQDLLHKKE